MERVWGAKNAKNKEKKNSGKESARKRGGFARRAEHFQQTQGTLQGMKPDTVPTTLSEMMIKAISMQ